MSLDGRQWLFEAATLEVSCLRLHCALMFYNNTLTKLTVAQESCTRNLHQFLTSSLMQVQTSSFYICYILVQNRAAICLVQE